MIVNMIEQVLLGLLLEGAMHGYELYQALQRRVGLVYAVNHVTQLYPFLRKMRDRGWVAERVEISGRPFDWYLNGEMQPRCPGSLVVTVGPRVSLVQA